MNEALAFLRRAIGNERDGFPGFPDRTEDTHKSHVVLCGRREADAKDSRVPHRHVDDVFGTEERGKISTCGEETKLCICRNLDLLEIAEKDLYTELGTG